MFSLIFVQLKGKNWNDTAKEGSVAQKGGKALLYL